MEAEIKRAAVGQYEIPVERSTVGGKFPQAPREEKSEIDMRKPLDPNIDAIKKVAPAVQIPPEHTYPTSLIEKELENRRLGPASHDPIFKLVERRQDFGVVKIMEPYFEKKEDFSEGNVIDLYPNKPKRNRLVFKYMKPVERKIEAQIEPDTWVYYDVDLDAVRAELAKNVFMSGRMNATEF